MSKSTTPVKIGYRAELTQDDGGAWRLFVMRLGNYERLKLDRFVLHERTQRTYASAGDAVISLRHLLNSLPEGVKAK
jgi:hypothetical protein